MFAQQRQALILAEVNRLGGVRTAELGPALGVSGVTARRDVEALARRGLVARVRGGALSHRAGWSGAGGGAGRPGPAVRARGRHRGRAAVARAAARHARPGAAIGLLAGAATTMLARELLGVPGLTVVTNAIPVADTFHHEGVPDQTVVLVGGTLTGAGALTGPLAEHTAAGLNLDVLFLAPDGMTPHLGFTAGNPAEARTSARLVATARRLVVLADHGAWRYPGRATIAPLSAADDLITDDALDPVAGLVLRRRVGHLTIAAT